MNRGDRREEARDTDEGISMVPPPLNMYQAEVEEFSQALLENRPSQLEAELGLRSQKLITACYASARSGNVIEVN